ncbi:MAG: aminopeptidase P family protein [Oscillospiraceae bacterium]|nr:aminopeptidase P family protein [Oscillospiraceae bacterium]
MTNLEKMQSILCDQTQALLLTSQVSRLYAARYDVHEGVAMIGKGKCYYFTDSRYIEVAQNNLPDFTVQEMNREHLYPALINSALKELGAEALGIEEDYLTYGEYLYYEKSLSAQLVPCQKQISSFRQVKEPWELEYMKKAQQITDHAFAEICKILAPGMTEKEAATELIHCLLKNGSEGLAFDPIVVSGPNSSKPHGVPGERVMEYGDFVTMDFGAKVGGYCADMTRTVALGFVNEEMRRVYDIVLQAQEAAIAATKEGVTGAQVDGVARKIIEDAGYGQYFGHGYGHSVGLEIHEAPNCSPGNREPLSAGVVCSAEPGIYLPGKFGVRIEDVVIVTSDGCEDITRSPKNLMII